MVRQKGDFTMTGLRILGLIVVFMFLATGLGGCPLAEGFLWNAADPADLGSNREANGDSSDDAAAERANMLSDLAERVAAGEGGYELAWSYGYSTISINPNIDVGDTHERYRPPNADSPGGGSGDWFGDFPGFDGWGGNGGSDDSGGDGGSNDDDGSGDDDDSGDDPPCQPDSSWSGWDGDVYYGNIDVEESECLYGYGESGYNRIVCITTAFDQDGALYTPVHAFAYDDWLTVEVRFEGQTETYYVWPYDFTITVVSLTRTADTIDVVLDLDMGFDDENAAVTAEGTHTLHMEIDGDSMTYASQTHYDGYFRAGSASDPDWEGYGVQDFDCSGTLTKR